MQPPPWVRSVAVDHLRRPLFGKAGPGTERGGNGSPRSETTIERSAVRGSRRTVLRPMETASRRRRSRRSRGVPPRLGAAGFGAADPRRPAPPAKWLASEIEVCRAAFRRCSGPLQCQRDRRPDLTDGEVFSPGIARIGSMPNRSGSGRGQAEPGAAFVGVTPPGVLSRQPASSAAGTSARCA